MRLFAFSLASCLAESVSSLSVYNTFCVGRRGWDNKGLAGGARFLYLVSEINVYPYIERSTKDPPVLHTRDRFLYGPSSVPILLPPRFLLSYLIVSRNYITTNGANTIGAHKSSTRWYPYNEESTFPEGVDCLVAGVISYTAS